MPPPVKPFRLYAVTIHDATTREAIVPKFELGIIKSAWRGTKLTISATDDVREIQTNPEATYKALRNRYSDRHVAAYFPGPERLEEDMERAAEETATWLNDRAKWQAAEEARVRKITSAKPHVGGTAA